ncbi:MAG TPA: M1 family metallopeptidase [Chitinophagaceae bacterium]|nr:M1 family metallopeptidase [Chitinophagaceae bacterium]
MLKHSRLFFFLSFSLLLTVCSYGQLGQSKNKFTEQDTLRGSNGPGRQWWDIQHYAIEVKPDITAQTISGKVTIRFKRTKTPYHYMQIDLQEPMILDKAIYNGKALKFSRNKNVYLLEWPAADKKPSDKIELYYHGVPRKAANAPWDGGWVWQKDKLGRPWITVACQGLGASVWYPCKDYQGDEPDNGAALSITVPDSLVAVGNGNLQGVTTPAKGLKKYVWVVESPINNYNIIPYIGKYANWTDSYTGEEGKLDCSYWVLDYNVEASKKQFGRDVARMMKCFEHWFGPYPFYKDSYKMVETHHLGMEHQSAVAYGNQYKDGYLGMDLSRSGWGMKWDYIIIHETGHEWFANNITTEDIADMWIHEGFTTYSEVLFVECEYGKQAADEYCQGLRRGIANRSPVIGPYGVNEEGSGDMYPKGANLLHTIRQVIGNDETFRQILRGLNKDFYHGITTSAKVEQYFTEKSGKDLSKIFDQYLRQSSIPVLEYKAEGTSIAYRWASCVPGFNMPVKVKAGDTEHTLQPTEQWQQLPAREGDTFSVDKNYYIQIKKAA